jgi:hypothetical protein
LVIIQVVFVKSPQFHINTSEKAQQLKRYHLQPQDDKLKELICAKRQITVGTEIKLFHMAQIMSIFGSVSCHDSCGHIMLESQAQG